jgi:diguanylate cyclase (GGDEF)-like protein
MAYSMAAMYGGAIGIDVIDGLVPGGSGFSVTPDLVGLGIIAVILAVGRRLPRWVLALFSPVGVALLAYAVGSVPGAGDGAVLYMWPVLWTVFFFGLPGAIAVVACIGVAHGIVLLSLAPPYGYFDRWVDVMASVTVVAAVIQMLMRNSDRLHARLVSEARMDKLTGLLNRRGFDERAAIEMAHAKRDKRSIAVASFDIDYFKRINDEWGHETGDRVLARLGVALTSQSRDVDVVARLGGDEFVAVLPGADSADADAFAARVRRALADADTSGLSTVRVSAGVASAIAPESIEPLLLSADSALYAAKRDGRNRIVVPQHPDTPLRV